MRLFNQDRLVQNIDLHADRDKARPVPWMFGGAAYRERADPRFAPATFLELGLAPGPLIEPGPGSNCPGGIF